jgi:deoxyribodipyrimidine photo-lyase
VASTFSSKPYFSNKETISRFSGGQYCEGCLAQCPFDASYEVLTAKLFNAVTTPAKQYVITHLPKKAVSAFPTMAIFVHDEMLSAANPIFDKPFPKIFVFDPQIHGAWSLNRLQFVADCLSEIKNVEVWLGDTEEVLIKRGVGRVVTQDTPNRRVRELLDPFVPKYEPVPKLVNVEISPQRLKRFSRYWEKVSPYILRPT